MIFVYLVWSNKDLRLGEKAALCSINRENGYTKILKAITRTSLRS
jgi:hypothetical protein